MTRLSEQKLVEMWGAETEFTLTQAAALWIGESPPSCVFDFPDDPEGNPKNFPERYLENHNEFINRFNIIQRAIGDGKTGELKAIRFICDDEYDEFGKTGQVTSNRPHQLTRVKKDELKDWATRRGERPKFLFPEDVSAISDLNKLKSCLDQKHEWYSRELAIAIETWIHLYGNGNINRNKGEHKKQIKAHVSETEVSRF